MPQVSTTEPDIVDVKRIFVDDRPIIYNKIIFNLIINIIQYFKGGC